MQIIVTASGSLPSDVERVWRCRAEGVYHVEYGFSCMGYEVNAALGVKLAEPQRDVYVLVGDGSFNMLHSEFLTSLQQDLKINIVLLDNYGFHSNAFIISREVRESQASAMNTVRGTRKPTV